MPKLLRTALALILGITVVGCIVAASHRAFVAYAIGVVFLCGGIAASFMIPAPTWFEVLDLAAAYLPMAWLGLAIAYRLKPGVAT